MKKKVLVCGATGFIGRNIAESLSKRDDLEIYGTYFSSPPLENEKIQMIKADLTKKQDVDKVLAGKDVVIQTAATTSGSKDIVTRPYIHATDNAIMNSLIFRSAFENNLSHVIFPSCCIMYQSSSTPLKEKDFNLAEPIPEKYFGAGWTKLYIEKMCEFYSNLGKTKYTVMRHTNIYGPHDKFDLERSHVFGATITKVLTTPENGAITVWGTGEEERDLLYVSDLADFVSFAIDKQESEFELLNVSFGKSISVAELVKKIISHSEKTLEVQYDTSKPTIKTIQAIDSAKAKALFSWRPKVDLDQGIKKTISWYRENIKI